MDNLYFYVGIIGNIISVLMFLSPMKTFWRIVKKGSTEEFESLPYICTLLNSSLWTYYGITKPGSYLVATVNGFGILVEILYLSLFLIYAPPRTRGKTAMVAGLVDGGVFAVAVLMTQFWMEGEMRIDVIGLLGAGLNILMYASPLSAMVPNGTGFVLGFAQLAVYSVYKNSYKSAKVVSNGFDEGCQHESLLPSTTSNPIVPV